MKKYIISILAVMAVLLAAGSLIFKGNALLVKPQTQELSMPSGIQQKDCSPELLQHLQYRKDNLALLEADRVLSQDPDNLCAWWARAEVLRRKYAFKEAEAILTQILAKFPEHIPSLISLAYVRYHDGNFETAQGILKCVLQHQGLERGNKALVYMLMGSVNAKKASAGGLFSKIAYGTRIKGYFEKANTLAPDLTEVHLGLGSFYLLAPKIAGGNIDKAIQELEYAVKIAPDFATANARLAQAYKVKGNLEKYNFYLKRAKELDPENEALKETE